LFPVVLLFSSYKPAWMDQTDRRTDGRTGTTHNAAYMEETYTVSQKKRPNFETV